MEDVHTQNTNRTNVVSVDRVDNRGEVSLDELMSRIRHIILTNRLRVSLATLPHSMQNYEST